MEYGFNHQGNAYFPSGQRSIQESKAETDRTNAETSRREVEAFKTNPPEKYFLYINEKTGKATTWIGDVLGDVEFGAEYKCPAFGWHSTRVAVTIKAINGRTYYGTYYKSSGDYARVRLAKGQ